MNGDLFARRMAKAARLRERVYPGAEAVRLVFGESDGLPGLVVDRYGPVLVGEALSLGVEMRWPHILEALTHVFQPEAVVKRNDSPLRRLEGLPIGEPEVWGDVPGDLVVDFAGLGLSVDPLTGQKTGLYLDQRDNLARVAAYGAGRRVADVCCHGGAFGLSCLNKGAKSVVFVDSSPGAMEQARANSSRNGYEDGVEFAASDMFEFFKGDERFDLIVLDPPSFVRKKSRLAQALKGYQSLNSLAMSRLNSGGILATFSCSHHVGPDVFLDTVRRAARRAGRRLTVLERLGQSRDHPVLLAMPETEYLCGLILEAA